MSYHFPPNDKISFLFGLSRMQVIAAGTAVAAVVAGSFLEQMVLGAALALIVTVVTIGSWNGVSFRERIQRRARWFRVRSTGEQGWAADVNGVRRQEWPPCMSGVSIGIADPEGDWAYGDPVGIITVRKALSIVLPVAGEQMALLSGDEAAERLRGWGDVLSSLCGERSEVGIARVSWCDVHGAADPRSLVRFHDERGVPGPTTSEYRSYVGSIATTSAAHQVYVTITVDERAARNETKLVPSTVRGVRRMELAVMDQAQAFARELRARGFTVDRPLSPLAVSRLIRTLGDPFAPQPTLSTAAERLALPEAGQAGPLQVRSERLYVAVDGAVHRTFQVLWPARSVPADWMWTLLSAAGGPKFTTVVYEPVAPSLSNRRLNTAMARSSSNNDVQNKRKGRVSAKGRAQYAALQARENELVAGHAEMESYAIVVVSARTEEDLERRSVELQRAAVRCGGARLRPLDTMHDLGWVAGLPLGMRVAKPKG